MDFIRTINGDIMPTDLGWCQCHEHIFIKRRNNLTIPESLCMDSYVKTLNELMLYKNAGGCSLVDAQPIGTGRMEHELCRAAEESGVNIIATTGFHKPMFYEDSSFILNISEDKLTQCFIDEIEYGMYEEYNSGKRITACAGAIKVAVEEGGINKSNTSRKLFEASANAALATGSPIICHIDRCCDPIELIKFYTGKNINTSKLIICHLDRVCYDFSIHKEILGTGAYLEYDTINRLKYHDNNYEINLITRVISLGYIKRLLLSLDTTNERLKNYGANFGLDYICTDFSLLMESAGIEKELIEYIMTQNPQEALTISKTK